MIELIEPLQKQPLDDDPGYTHDEGRNDDGPPIAQSGILQEKVRGEGAQHVLGAVREVDDVEHAEDDGKPEAQQRVERAVDESDEQLAEQRLRADTEQFEHGCSHRWPGSGSVPLAALAASPRQLFANGQPPSAKGRKASSAGIVARSL